MGRSDSAIAKVSQPTDVLGSRVELVSFLWPQVRKEVLKSGQYSKAHGYIYDKETLTFSKDGIGIYIVPCPSGDDRLLGVEVLRHHVLHSSPECFLEWVRPTQSRFQ